MILKGEAAKLGYKKNSPYKNAKSLTIDFGRKGGVITMKGVDKPLLGIPDKGRPALMQPNKDYNFPEASKVTEYPMKIKKQYRTFQTGDKFNVSKMAPRKGAIRNSDGTDTTHFMKREYIDGKGWVVFPSVFQNSKNDWVNMSDYGSWYPIYKEAKKRGEVFEFGDDLEKAINFADKGSWKSEFQFGRGLTTKYDNEDFINWWLNNKDENFSSWLKEVEGEDNRQTRTRHLMNIDRKKHYDYQKAWEEGDRPFINESDKKYYWGSSGKGIDHPTK